MSQAMLSPSPYRNSSLFSGYYLDERIDDLEEWDCDQAAQETFEELQRLWELEGELVPGYKEDELLDSWIDEVLDILGFGTQSETTVPGDASGYNDRLLFDSDETRRQAAKRAMDGDHKAMYGMAAAVLEAKQWDTDFSKRFNERRSYRDASHQIKYYLEHTPERLRWGILTDGKKWRLYGTKNYATEIYYEVDLPELLEAGRLDDFKYFYAFFRPEAFREIAGTSFLDTVWNESETAAQELGEDLQDNVFTALRILGEGFIHTNDLEIDPDDEDARAELKEQSLVLLYRLMFVLYAESRGLIHPDNPDARSEFEENFSLDQIRLEIHEAIESGDSYDDWSGYATQIWGQLEDLFRLINEGKESLGIPSYNGGLFDKEEHTFLAENEVADRYIAEVIHRLGTTEDEDGNPVLADYADLDTRHLGSIYEGLLEHEFRIASESYAAVAEDGGQVWKSGTEVSVAEAVETVEEGELYVVNDDGERKATGAYYTPDYVVSYIIEETIDPLLDEIRTELEEDGLDPSDQAYFGRFYSEVQELKILDPAMGSAHFLTRATGYLTEQVMEIVREQEKQGRNEQTIRRTIAKECIYGVDVNKMAVELGKLSMWLETLAADKPLAFLDHHLKDGNSLVGSDISEVLSDDTEENGGQLTLAQAFVHARQQTLGHVMNHMEELLAIDNEDLADIKSMEELYDEIREDPLYQRLFEVANVHTAEEFGLDVPEGAYKKMASAIEDNNEWNEIRSEDWFGSAQVMADDKDFFHWELEYPEVFFDKSGEKLDGGGFDVVVGNPPYGMVTDQNYADYYDIKYECSQGRPERYSFFTEKAHLLCQNEGLYGYIVSNTILTNELDEKIRGLLLEETEIKSIALYDEPVFDDPTVHSTTIIAQRRSPLPEHTVRVITGASKNMSNSKQRHVKQKEWSQRDGNLISIISNPEEAEIWWRIQESTYSLGDVAHIRQCIKTGDNDKYLEKFDDEPGEPWKTVLTGRDINRYVVDWPNRYVKYGDWLARNWKNQDFYEREKIAIRETSDRITAALDSKKRYLLSTLYSVYFREEYNDKSLTFLLAIINSNLAQFFMYHLVFSTNEGAFTKARTNHYERLPIVFPDESKNHLDDITDLVSDIQSTLEYKSNLNLSLFDHFGSYSDGLSLADIGLTQPPRGSADSILQETTEQKPNLRVGEATVVRESKSTVEIQLTARYKPDDQDAYETDQWGYTETEPLSALRITDLTDTEADLIEVFVPVAVDEAGGFANFRETATKTNSLVDRLRKLTLPAADDVRDGLESYIATKQRAEELEAKIEKTDELIDEIVYELYGLTDEEIEIVEEAVRE